MKLQECSEAYLKKARLSLGGDNRLLIVLPDGLSASMVGREDHVQELEQLIEEKIGKKSRWMSVM